MKKIIFLLISMILIVNSVLAFDNSDYDYYRQIYISYGENQEAPQTRINESLIINITNEYGESYFSCFENNKSIQDVSCIRFILNDTYELPWQLYDRNFTNRSFSNANDTAEMGKFLHALIFLSTDVDKKVSNLKVYYKNNTAITIPQYPALAFYLNPTGERNDWPDVCVHNKTTNSLTCTVHDVTQSYTLPQNHTGKIYMSYTGWTSAIEGTNYASLRFPPNTDTISWNGFVGISGTDDAIAFYDSGISGWVELVSNVEQWRNYSLYFIWDTTGGNSADFYVDYGTSQEVSSLGNSVTTGDLTSINIYHAGEGMWIRDMILSQIEHRAYIDVKANYTLGERNGAVGIDYVYPTPADGIRVNTEQTINISSSDTQIRYYLWFKKDDGNFSDTDLVLENSTTGIYNTQMNLNGNGIYYYQGGGYNITSDSFINLTPRNLYYDTTKPTITINPSSSFNASNVTLINQYKDNNFLLNITFSDESDLFAVLINITKNNIVYYNYSNISIETNNLNFVNTLNISSWAIGIYKTELLASDSHTKNEIKDYQIGGFLNTIEFNTAEHNRIKIKAYGAYSFNYKKHIDRYNFGFKYLTKNKEHTFEIETQKKIYYLPNSKYKGHFVVLSNNMKEGNWIDFEEYTGTIKSVKKVNDNKYIVTIIDKIAKKELNFDSIGGLNVEWKNYTWYKGTYETKYNNPVTTESYQTFILNITKDNNYIKNISTIFKYNGTSYDITKTDYDDYILFETSLNVPSQEGTYSFNWEVTITEQDNYKYSFNITKNQTLHYATLNITIYDEENNSIITEPLTIYFTLEQSIEKNTSNGNLVVGNLTLGEYFIQAEGTNYPRRGIFYNLTNQSNYLNLYLCFNELGNDYIDFYTKNTGQEYEENARYSFFRTYNTSSVLIAQGETDYAGQIRLFLDQQYEYTIIIDHKDYPLKTITLFPLLTSYSIILDKAPDNVYSNAFNGIYYTLYPAKKTINISNNYINITLDIYSSNSNLEYFGIEITNISYSCIPSNCISNITGSPVGGTATVKILPNETGYFNVHYYFKPSGFEKQYINANWFSVILEKINTINVLTMFEKIKNSFGEHSIMPYLISVLGISMLCLTASQLGVIGLPLIVIAILGNGFFMAIGFLNAIIGSIIIIWGILIYVILSRSDE